MENNSNTTPKRFKVGIIGGGITGASAAHTLLDLCNNKNHEDDRPSSKQVVLDVHLFDQGRRGVGGRSSHRQHQKKKEEEEEDSANTSTSSSMRWDHGCQFFRADTDLFQEFVGELMEDNIVQEWHGDFRSTNTKTTHNDFFGLPSLPPFYVGVDGMNNVPKGILQRILQSQQQSNNNNNDNDNHDNNSNSASGDGSTCISPNIDYDNWKSKLEIFEGTRVANLERDESSNTWKLWGSSGIAAYHDTSETLVKQLNEKIPLGDHNVGYHAVILTDISSSFGSWHRASAGVPEIFASRVRERVGARVPLFTTMIAFESNSNIPFDAATFDDDTLWFAAKNNSKPGIMDDDDDDDEDDDDMKECWTLVSTPEYAMEKIEETPMQTPKGEFIPQTRDYLITVPGPDLLAAFRNQLLKQDGILDKEEVRQISHLPNVIHMDAQRWGSALPAHRHHVDKDSKTRKIISGVPYDSYRSALAPTKVISDGEEKNFLVDEDIMLFQAGDMMSTLTPGFESAAISGMDAAQSLFQYLSSF